MTRKPTYEQLEQRVKELEEEAIKRKRAEEERNELLKTIETAQESISIVSPDLVILYTNDSMHRLFGYEKGELIGKHISIVNAGPTPEAMAKQIANDLEKKGWWQGEVRNRKKDATEFISYATISAYKDKDGKIVSFVSTQHDITERKQPEEKLRKSEEQYRLLVETMNDGLAVVDENMVVTLVNDKLCQMIGYAQHELIGQPADSFLDEHNQRILKGQIDRRRLGKHDAYEIALTRKDGQQVFAIISPRPILDAEGRFKGAFAAITDISERVQAEEALRESEVKFRTQYQGFPIPTYTWQKTTQDFILIGYNNAAEAITRGRIANLVGKKAREMYSDQPEILAELSRCFAQKTVIKREMHYRLKSTGEEKYLAVSYAFVPPDLVLVHTEDITDRKQAEEKIKASLKEKEILLNEIHHRVKNNLQIISSLLDMRIMRTDNQQVIDVFEDTRSKIHTMALIHTQLYRSERFDQINIGTHIQELVEYLSRIHTSKYVLITPIIERSDVYLSITQAVPCGLVLNELVSNAFKHAFKEGQRGRIEISLKREDHNRVFLKVKDNGIGIPEDIDILKTNSLGLKLMRNTVQDQLRGKIYVERGVGTTIIVEFKTLEEEVDHV